jgi:hypothetical protein
MWEDAGTDPSRPPAQRPDGLRRAKSAVLLGLTLLLATLAYVALGLYEKVSAVLDHPARILNLAPSATATAAVMPGAALALRLRGASELTTAVHDLQTVVTVKQDRQLGGMTLGSTELLYVGIGQVRGGIDLADLGESAFQAEGSRLTVRLPAPRILDKKLDVERSYVYDQRRSLLGPLDPTLQGQAEKAALEQIWRGACEAGILRSANERAALTVRTLLEDAGYDQVLVQTQEPAEGECP